MRPTSTAAFRPGAQRGCRSSPSIRTIVRPFEHAAKALGDPTRLAVAVALRAGDRACVCDLAWIVGRDEKLVSHHARQLKAAGLARSERDGRMVMYSLTDRGRALLAAVSGHEAPA